MFSAWDDLGAAVSEGRWADALALAVDAWGALRAPSLAELVDALAVHVESPIVTRGATPDSFQEEWVGRARSADAAQFGGVIASLLRRPPPVDTTHGWYDPGRPFAAWRARLDALASRAPDPRTASALLRVVVERPTWAAGYHEEQSYAPLLAVLVRLADVRAIPPLRELAREPDVNNIYGTRSWLRDNAVRTADEIERALEAFPVRDGEREAAIGAWIESARAGWAGARRQVNDLLDAVLHDPDDNGARQVYADALMEIGDPRGEFIGLQFKEAAGDLAPKGKSRMSALLTAHEATWIGPALSRVLYKRVHRRGMLDEASLRSPSEVGGAVWREAIGDPRLATLRRLENGHANDDDYAAFIGHEALVGLRTIKARHDFALAALRGVVVEHVTELELGDPPIDETFRLLDDCAKALPSLRTLTILCVPADGLEALVVRVAESATCRRLSELVLDPRWWFFEDEDTTPWLRALDARRVTPRAVLRTTHATITVAWPDREGGAIVEAETHNGWGLEPLVGLARVARLSIRARGAGEPRKLGNAKELAEIISATAPREIDLPKTWADQVARVRG
jgi:uncharacterized protein (TIGR02996 family)